MADANDSGQSGRHNNMIEVARQAGEALPVFDHTAYIIIAVDIRTGSIGWVSQVPSEQVTEILGNIVASKRN